jgi:hypothetical protein
MIAAHELDRMPRTEGTCALCGKDTLVYALDEFTCRKCAAPPVASPDLSKPLEHLGDPPTAPLLEAGPPSPRR